MPLAGLPLALSRLGDARRSIRSVHDRSRVNAHSNASMSATIAIVIVIVRVIARIRAPRVVP